MKAVLHYKKRLLFAVGCLSAGIIAFQLALIQILSITQWYHFAYMVISVALLGFGAAGSFLSILRKRLVARADVLVPLLMIGTGIAMSLVVGISQASFFRFDSYLLFVEYRNISRLVLTYLLFFIPFFLGALSIGLVFVQYINAVGKIYFANLLGSGAGGLLALALIWIFFPQQLPALIAILPVLSGVILITNKNRSLSIAFAAVAMVAITLKCFHPPHLIYSEYKDISKTLLLPEAKITLEKTSPYGVVQTVSSPVLRYAPGMSLASQQAAQIKMAAFINGDWYGPVTDWKRTDTSMILYYTTTALPYIMAKRSDVLVLRSGTGIDVAHAVTRGTKNVVCVEPNLIIGSILKNEFATLTDSLFFHPGVSIHNLEPRTFLLMDTMRYDLVTLPMVGTFGGSTGLHALNEEFFLTREAFRTMWMKLKDSGVISITSWMDYPVRNPLKIMATMVEVLHELGIKDPKQHIAAIRSWGTITFVMTRSPLRKTEVNSIRDFCDDMMFDPAILPQLNSGERSQYNQFQDSLFFDHVDEIFSSGRERFYADYDFKIKPATDDRPYFSQYIKWNNLDRVAGFFGNRSIPFFEIGYLLVIITLIQISIISFVLILLPLIKIGWKGKNKRGIILYFGGIGLGYMFVEMVFIQRFILYFGNPVYAASAVITALLFFSGIGSYYSTYFMGSAKRLLLVFSMIVGLLFIYSFILTAVLQQTVHLNLLYKLLVIFVLTAPLAFCMGIPFAAGLSLVSKINNEVVPWAWAINGCVSVISTALATIASIELGFTWVMLLAALAYCLPLLVYLKWRVRPSFVP